MSSRSLRAILALLLVLSATVVASPGGDAEARNGNGASSNSMANAFQGRYIVVLDVPGRNVPNVARNLGRTRGFTVEHEYQHVITGFSARMSPQAAEALQRTPLVEEVVPDFEILLFDQTVPPGIERMGTLANATANVGGGGNPVDVDIAILDTGIQSSHPDLNYAGGHTCAGGSPSQDAHGHGTHVAGSAAARDNDVGVVGVAPGARLWSVKVFSDTGSGSFGDLTCGFDWVAANSGVIEVANFSGGGAVPLNNTADSVFHESIQNLVNNHGVTVAVAAGNNGSRVDGVQCGSFFFRQTCKIVPAAYPEVLTVGAMVDTDGQPGRLGPSTSHGGDDSRASFSNRGSLVDVYAPGSQIRSTLRTGGYGNLSGTSMASPHVAGAAALYLATDPGASPDTVRQALMTNGVEHGGFDSFNQPLAHVAGFAPPEPVFDVAVSALEVESSVFVDEASDVTVSVANGGNQQMDNASVTLTAGGNPVGSAQTVSLNPGASQNVVFNWTPASAQDFELEGSISHTDDANAANNSQSANVTAVNRVRDVAVTSVSASPSSINQGQSTTVAVQVQNNGTQDDDVSVSLSTSPSTGVSGPGAQQQNIPAGETRTFSFDWSTSNSTTVQNYTVEATASISGHTDANTGDNAGDTTVTVNEKPPVPSVFVEDLTGSGSRSGFYFWVTRTLNGQVHIRNEGGQNVSGAEVSIRVTGPNYNQTVNVSTSSNGTGSFSTSVSNSGTYTYQVLDVSVSGHPYDSNLNKVNSIQVQVP